MAGLTVMRILGYALVLGVLGLFGLMLWVKPQPDSQNDDPAGWVPGMQPVEEAELLHIGGSTVYRSSRLHTRRQPRTVRAARPTISRDLLASRCRR